MGQSAITAADGGLHGFPAAWTSFVGRAAAIRDIAGLLERHRLVTVTGPGGAGKTRLAGEVARRVAARFADGAWLAELAPVSRHHRCPPRLLRNVQVVPSRASCPTRTPPGTEPGSKAAQPE